MAEPPLKRRFSVWIQLLQGRKSRSSWTRCHPDMREIVFDVAPSHPQGIKAKAEERQLRIVAASLEELHEEARDALIQHFGPAHTTYRVRFRHPAIR